MKHIVQLLGLVAVAVLAGACQDPLGPEFKEVSEAESRLQFYGPGLEGGYRRFMAGHDEHYVKRTTGIYGPRSGEYPQAMMHFVEMPPRRHFTRVAKVDEALEDWGRFKDKKLTVGDPGVAVNRIGRAEFVPVVADGVACVVWRQIWGPQYAQGEGTMLLDGFYCKGPGPMMSHADSEAIVQLAGHMQHGPIAPPEGMAAGTRMKNDSPFMQIRVYWEGNSRSYSGQLVFDGTTEEPGMSATWGKLTLFLGPHGSCAGRFEFDEPDEKGVREGAWNANCADGKTVKGSFSLQKSKPALTGSGKDSDGRAVRFEAAG